MTHTPFVNSKHQRTAFTIVLAAAIGVVMTVVMVRSLGWKTKTGEARLQSLLADWQIALPVPNLQAPINYARTSSAREGSMEYFKLRIEKGEAEAILVNEDLAKRLQFRRKAEFHDSRSRSWWNASPGATCFWGTIDSVDKKRWITIYIVRESENDWLFIESFSEVSGTRQP
jgi:hypothetical protein